METVISFLEQQPFLSLFVVIATGYALGSINIKGLSLGSGAVIFTGLFVGAIAPKAHPPAMIATLGLVMFLYGLGVQYGKQFFAGLTSSTGRRYNLLAVIALSAATVVTVFLLRIMHVSSAMMAGIFAGSGTNSATMQAATEAAQNTDPAIGYSLAYPFGIIGAILCMYIMQILVKPKIEESKSGLETIEVVIQSGNVDGMSVKDVLSKLPSTVQILIVRSGNENKHPDPDQAVNRGDVMLLGSNDKISLTEAQKMLGKQVRGPVVSDRSDMDFMNIFVSKSSVVGIPVQDIVFPEGIQATITHVQRGDTELLNGPGLTLEIGDRIGILTHRKYFKSLRNFFGNSIRGTTEFSYISLGIGMVMGVLLGIIPIPLPVIGTMKLGIAGGSLIVALILGKLGRTGKLTWTMPLSANLTLRNFGLSIFLAQVGMSSGAPFVQVVSENGLVLLLAGAAILLALAVTPLLIGYYVMKIPFDDLLGITSGITGNPAILAYAYRSFPSDRMDICYAMIFPAVTILKIIIALVLVAIPYSG
jgi:putative transport protein